MEKRTDYHRFGVDPGSEVVVLACPRRSEGPHRRLDSEVGGRLPRWLRYSIDKAQALYDFVGGVRDQMKRKRRRGLR